MYLSTNTCLTAFSHLAKISDLTTGKQAGERLSALRYFFALTRFLKETGASDIDLSPPQTEHRQRFTDFVGDIVKLGTGNSYTNNFSNDFKDTPGYGVSSNFLTTSLKKDGYYPGRPVPLIIKEDEHLSLHPDWKTNIHLFGDWSSYSTHLLVWLSRFTEFEASPDLGTQVKNHIENTYGKEILDLCLDDRTLNDLLADETLSSSISDLRLLISHPAIDNLDNNELLEPIALGRNIIFYGAPGTGKSHRILKQECKNVSPTVTVFHPDTQYCDFVGSLKPSMKGNDITYQFRPGPFTEALIEAVNDDSKHHFLVIEEINRASAAAVFGEIFQLLDREADGSSTYSINISDPDLLLHLNTETQNAFSDKKISIPKNLSLLATMNSSDQAVMPMDTAFKRRWEFEYLRIDYTKASIGELVVNVSGLNGTESCRVSWGDFAETINCCLIAEGIAEDRLLGHRFINENELKSNPDKVLKGKLLMYLWDDVLRHGQHEVVFRQYADTDKSPLPLTNFGQLISAYERGLPIFNDNIEQALINCSIKETAKSSVENDEN
ncbi:McrB family protein [Vibrio bathopelagicus]